jgi:hypothetical protein
VQPMAGDFRRIRLPPPPEPPGPNGPLAMTEVAWRAIRAPVRYVWEALDTMAITAWALLALTLLVLTVGQAFGAFDATKTTSHPLQVRPVPALSPNWQPPPPQAR